MHRFRSFRCSTTSASVPTRAARRVGQHLRDAGVPALAEPVVGEVGTASRATTPPKRPTERVHVDGEQVLNLYYRLAGAVPEPLPSVLLASGLIALSLLRRRRPRA